LILALALVAPLLAVEPSLGLVFFGDSGTGREGQQRVAQGVAAYCAAQRCDLLALLGDNINPGGVTGIDDPQWQYKVEDPYGTLGLVIRPVLGNHDHRGDADAQVRYSDASALWDMPAPTYAFEQGPVAFFALDTQHMDRRQRRWLARGLRHSTAPWTVVYGHHPLRSHGVHGPAQGRLRRIERLVERHADFYLSGHDHDQQVIRGQATHVVMGSGGSPPRPVQEGPDTLYAASQRGFGHLLLSPQLAVLTVVRANGEPVFVYEVSAEPTD